MAGRYLRAIRAARPDGPYHLAGWSLGGVIAFEMARQLAAEGAPVGSVSLIDSRPTLTGRRFGPRLDESVIAAAFADDLASRLGRDGPALLAICDDPEALAAYRRFLEGDEAAEVPDVGIDPETVRRLFRTYRSGALALARYRPRRYPGRLTLFVSDQASDAADGDPTFGWASLAAGGIALHRLAGDHASILRPPTVTTLAAHLRAAMDGPDGDAAGGRA